jgi:hypothetical protein
MRGAVAEVMEVALGESGLGFEEEMRRKMAMAWNKATATARADV